MDLTESLEDYLEAIYIYLQEQKVVRVKDLMKHFNYKSSSVNTAIVQLKKKGLVDHEKYGYIDLTPAGRKLAKEIYQKHEKLTRFLRDTLGINGETAENDACRMEHILSDETYETFYRFIKYLEQVLTRKKLDSIIEQFKKLPRETT
ncbi:metal-dependent transcriptional regulator [Marispirochaeta sp.]|uniref:metal-dependent transcriptional regulator n=1 Tax=Marispirochaeta sp. TaxID=2038653 RepID=UPI0029C8E6AC|nr:metal-dependent transcriptional regulator [Marispirochaeta sp.]